MKQIQMVLTDKADQVATLFKMQNGLRTKAEAVNKILEMHGGTL